jgi:hypothetical protein
MMVVLEDAASYGPKTGLMSPSKSMGLRCGQIIDDVCGGFLSVLGSFTYLIMNGHPIASASVLGTGVLTVVC